MNLYETSYSNEVHQLLITASRHLHVLKDGRVRYQKKKMEGDWQWAKDPSKDQVIHYIMRDHYSHAMYAEIHTRDERISPQEFLFRAWAEKDDYPFYGMPEVLMLPASISSEALRFSLEKLGIEVIRPTGGFMAGVRTFRDWDRILDFVSNNPFDAIRSFKELQARTPEVVRNYYDQDSDGQSKSKRWQSNLRNLRLPPRAAEFLRIFSKMNNDGLT